jgi:hypothetical protein
MRRLVKRSSAFVALVAAMASLALAGSGCVVPRTRLQPRDLTPVTWLAAPEHPPVEIVRDGQARAVVYVADLKARETFDPDKYTDPRHGPKVPPALIRLVDELVEVVRLGTGATLERVDQSPPADRPAIVIGDCEETRRAGIDAARLPAEGFVVKTASNRVFLVGSTQALPAGSTGTSDGTAWAVADFLERFAGVRWYWPAQYGGRSIPRSGSLVIPRAHYRDQPVCRMRTMYNTGCSLRARAFDEHIAAHLAQEILPTAPGVLPKGATRISVAHHLPLWRSGVSLPYQAVQHGARDCDLVNQAAKAGKRPLAVKEDGSPFKRLCYSKPGTLDFVIETCERVWDKKTPVWGLVRSSGVSVWWPDIWGPRVCHCSACRATANRGGEDLIMGLFVRRLCEEVERRWPDKKVIYMPWTSSCPEEVEFPDNLIVHYLDAGRIGLMHQAAYRREQEARIRAWSEKSGRTLTIWCDFGSPSDWTYAPVQYPHVVKDFYLKNRGLLGGSYLLTYSPTCWTTAAPTCYVWMRVLWNPQLDVDAALDEMCRRLFGPAADTAGEFLRLQCERWEGATWTRPLVEPLKGTPGSGWMERLPLDHFRESWPPDVVARMKALRDKALAEMADSPNARKAFLYWTYTFDEFLKEAKAVHQKKTP